MAKVKRDYLTEREFLALIDLCHAFYTDSKRLSDYFINRLDNAFNIYADFSVDEALISKHADKLTGADWSVLSENVPFSEAFIRDNIDKVDLYGVCEASKLSEEFIRELEDRLDNFDWELIFQYQKLSESFIEEYAHKVTWKIISRYCDLSEAFIRKHAADLNFGLLSEYHKNFSAQFIRDYAERLNWKDLVQNSVVPIELLHQYRHKLDRFACFWLSHTVRLPEIFIREFADKVDWRGVSRLSILSESFIREFQDRICWDQLRAKGLSFSEAFKEEFKDKL